MGDFVRLVTEDDLGETGLGRLRGLRQTGPSDIVAHMLTLPHAERVALLRELLRAAPDAAVEAVDTSRVARGWSDGRWSLDRCGSWPVADVYENSYSGGWVVYRPDCEYQEYESGDAAMAAADAALVADGWVLAGVSRG